MGLPSRKLERRCELFGEKPLIILRLDSWLQLDFVHTERLWHCRSSPLLTNHLSHLLMVATRSRQEIPRTVTANPRTRLCLRSGVIPRRTVCTWADLTAVIGFHPNLKPLQRHKGVRFWHVGRHNPDVTAGLRSTPP